jgi:YVTN family beta-propeller protein
MRINTRVLTIAIILAGVVSASAQTPMLAVATRGDKAVTLYNLLYGGVLPELATTISTGQAPGEMCISPDAKRLFVSVPSAKSIAVIDLGSKTVIATLSDPGLQSPDGCVVSADSKKLYSVDQTANAVFVFSTESRQLLKKIPVGQKPRRAILTPDGKRVVVAVQGANILSILDASTDTIVSTVKTGNEPKDLVYSADGKLLAVALINDDSTAFFKADTLEFKQQVASAWSPQHMEFAPDSRHLYVMGKFTNSVAVMKVGALARLENVIAIPHGPLGIENSYGMAMTPDGKYLYAANFGDDTISVLEPQTLKSLRTIPGGKSPLSLLYIKATGTAKTTATSAMPAAK